MSDGRRRSAYYALVLRLAEGWVDKRSRLVEAMHAEGFADVDIPKATSPLHTLAAFQEPISPVYRYDRACIRRQAFPGADALAATTIKVSVPASAGRGGGQEDEAFFEALEAVLTKLAGHGFFTERI